MNVGQAAEGAATVMRPSQIKGMIVALLCVAATAGLRWAFDPYLETRLPLMFFLTTGLLASWFGGLWPGLLAFSLGGLIGVFGFMLPHYEPGNGFVMEIHIVAYIILAALSVAVCESLHRSRHRAERARADAVHRAALLQQQAQGLQQAQRSLRENEELLRLAQEAGGAGTFEWEVEQRRARCSHSFFKIMGIESQDGMIATSKWEKVVHPDDLPRLNNHLRRAMHGDEPFQFDYRIVRPDGSERWISYSGSFVPESQRRRVRGVVIDITERKRAELESAQLRNQLAADLADMKRLHELNTRLLDQHELHAMLQEVLTATVRLLGTSKGNVQLYDEKEQTLRIVAHLGFDEEFLRTFEVVPTGYSVCGKAMERLERVIVENAFTDPDVSDLAPVYAKFGFVAVQSTPLFGSRGQLLGMLNSHFAQPHRPTERELRMLDLYAQQAVRIIERSRAEQALQRSERNLSDFFENAAIGLHWVDSNGTILRANAAELAMLGYKAEEYIGHHIGEFHDDPEALESILTSLHCGETVKDREARLRCKDGSIRHVRIHSNVLWEDGKFVHTRCFTRDVTAEKLAEEARQRHAERLQTLYRLSEAVNRATGVEEMCELAMDGLQGTVLADRASVLLFDPDGVMRFKASRGISAEYRAAVEGHSPWKQDDAQAQPFGIDDAMLDEGLAAYRPVFEKEGIRALGFIPMIDGGRVLGKFMVYYDQPHRFTEEELAICRAIASTIAFSINRAQAERALRESEERYRRLVSLMPAGIYACEAPHGTITYYNKRAVELWGREPKLGDRDHRFCGAFRLFRADGSFMPHDQTPMARALRDGVACRNQDVLIERPDGTKVWALVNIDPIHDEQGRVIGAINVFVDQTAAREAERSRRESEERLRLAMEAGKVGVWDWDIVHNRVTWTDSLYAIHGMQPGEFKGTVEAFADLVHPHDAARVQEAMRKTLEEDVPYELEFRAVRPDGRVVWLFTNAAVARDEGGRPLRLMGATLDVTERKHAEQALAQSEGRFRGAFEQAPFPMQTFGPDGNIRMANPAWVALWKTSIEELEGYNILKDEQLKRKGVMPLIERAFAGEPVQIRPLLYDPAEIEKVGRPRWVEAALYPLRDPEGRVFEVVLTLHDVTVRINAEKALKEALERQSEHAAELSAIMDTAPIPLFVAHDAQCRAMTCNAAATRLLRLDRSANPSKTSDAPPQHFRVFRDGVEVPSDDLPVQRCARLNEVVAGEQVDVVFDGDPLPRRLLINAIPLRNAQGESRGAVSAMIDLTEQLQVQSELQMHRERLEELVVQRTMELEHTHQALRLSERMAAMGTLVAGLGHDMGNLLLPVRARLESLRHASLDDAAGADLLSIHSCIEHLQRLASGLRLFALDPEADVDLRGSTHLPTWRLEVEPFMRNALPRAATLVWDLHEDIPEVGVARHRFTQAVYNLVKNAADALGEQGGQVRVWAARAEDGQNILVGVSDNGPGMSEDVKRRCLEPFFTTKPRGLSTGLGLSLVHGIVQRCQGQLRIDTEPGCGTSIVLKLPAYVPPQELPDAPRHRARLTLQDARTSGYVSSILSRAGVNVVRESGPPNGNCDVWIADWTPEHWEAARQFVAADGRRQAVLIGAPHEALLLEELDERLSALAGPVNLSEMREYLHRRVLNGSSPRVAEPDAAFS